MFFRIYLSGLIYLFVVFYRMLLRSRSSKRGLRERRAIAASGGENGSSCYLAVELFIFLELRFLENSNIVETFFV